MGTRVDGRHSSFTHGTRRCADLSWETQVHLAHPTDAVRHRRDESRALQFRTCTGIVSIIYTNSHLNQSDVIVAQLDGVRLVSPLKRAHNLVVYLVRRIFRLRLRGGPVGLVVNVAKKNVYV